MAGSRSSLAALALLPPGGELQVQQVSLSSRQTDAAVTLTTS